MDLERLTVSMEKGSVGGLVAPPEFPILNNLKNFRAWQPWYLKDSRGAQRSAQPVEVLKRQDRTNFWFPITRPSDRSSTVIAITTMRTA